MLYMYVHICTVKLELLLENGRKLFALEFQQRLQLQRVSFSSHIIIIICGYYEYKYIYTYIGFACATGHIHDTRHVCM